MSPTLLSWASPVKSNVLGETQNTSVLYVGVWGSRIRINKTEQALNNRLLNQYMDSIWMKTIKLKIRYCFVHRCVCFLNMCSYEALFLDYLGGGKVAVTRSCAYLERKGQVERGVEGRKGKVRMGKRNERETCGQPGEQEAGPETLTVDHNFWSRIAFIILVTLCTV